MRRVRALLRLLLVTSVTTPIYVAVLLCKPLRWFSPTLGARAHYFWVGLWARGMARILGVTIETRGKPPEPPFFLVSNHLSYVDIVVLLTHLRGVFLAKHEIAGWPVLGIMARTAGTLFVNRGRRRDLGRVIAEVEQQLAAGGGVVVFPEGTSTKGEAVLPFKASLFEVAVRTRTPVSYAALHYVTPEGAPPAHLAVCWWGDMPFLPHFFELLMLPSIRATVAFGAEPLMADDRKSLATRARTAVEAHFTPVGECRA